MSWIREIGAIPVWKKYSQQNEECYIEFILSKIPSINRYIVELGAWDGYHLSNTRYFIEKGYKALLIDGDNHGNEEVKQHFITRENILEILEKYETPREFDLLCIDIDGNDIYVLERILSVYEPYLIVAEFNPIFEHFESKAIKYDPEHIWNNDNFYGFSFAAGIKMAEKFGYVCVHQSDSLNMYFVKAEFAPEVPNITYQIKHDHPTSTKKDWVEYK